MQVACLKGAQARLLANSLSSACCALSGPCSSTTPSARQPCMYTLLWTSSCTAYASVQTNSTQILQRSRASCPLYPLFALCCKINFVSLLQGAKGSDHAMQRRQALRLLGTVCQAPASSELADTRRHATAHERVRLLQTCVEGRAVGAAVHGMAHARSISPIPSKWIGS